MIEVDAGIYTLLAADIASNAAGSLGSLGVTGAYVNGDIPENAVEPFIRFGELAAPATHTMGGGPIEYEIVYQVLAIDDRDGDGANGKLRAAAIAHRVKTLTHKQPLVLAAPMRHLRSLLDRRIDLPDLTAGKSIEQVGANYRIWVEES